MKNKVAVDVEVHLVVGIARILLPPSSFTSFSLLLFLLPSLPSPFLLPSLPSSFLLPPSWQQCSFPSPRRNLKNSARRQVEEISSWSNPSPLIPGSISIGKIQMASPISTGQVAMVTWIFFAFYWISMTTKKSITIWRRRGGELPSHPLVLR